MNKTSKIVIGIMGGMALLFLLLGFGLKTGFEIVTKDYIAVQGEIVDFRGGNPVIGYEIDGYEGVIRSSTHNMDDRIGKRITVRVDPADYAHAMDETLPLLGWIFMLVGASLSIPAIVMLVMEKRRKQLYDQLLTYGHRVTVTIDDIRLNRMVSVNKRHPSRLYASCVHPVTREQVELHSHDLWKLNYQIGDRVDVLFDPMNEKKYVFETQEDA